MADVPLLDRLSFFVDSITSSFVAGVVLRVDHFAFDCNQCGNKKRCRLVAPWRARRTWPCWPGAVRHVQRETLKAPRPVAFAGFQLPAAGLSPATALESRRRKQRP